MRRPVEDCCELRAELEYKNKLLRINRNRHRRDERRGSYDEERFVRFPYFAGVGRHQSFSQEDLVFYYHF